MKRLMATVLALTGIGSFACAALAPAAPPAALSTSRPGTPPVPSEFVPSPLPITPTYEGCAYVWGTQPLPVLSRQFNAALQDISLDVSGMAYAYGEDCVYGDGHKTFSAMETDFTVGVIVKSVKDEAALGDWIYKVMQVVLALPPDELKGPQPGRVEFDFKQPDPAELFVIVPIERYRREAGDLKGVELFRLFHTSP